MRKKNTRNPNVCWCNEQVKHKMHLSSSATNARFSLLAFTAGCLNCVHLFFTICFSYKSRTFTWMSSLHLSAQTDIDNHGVWWWFCIFAVAFLIIRISYLNDEVINSCSLYWYFWNNKSLLAFHLFHFCLITQKIWVFFLWVRLMCCMETTAHSPSSIMTKCSLDRGSPRLCSLSWSHFCLLLPVSSARL